ncbi:MAG: hypothetical protein ACTSQE_16430, partial [Candidatus Heimdallarchaeaceae archaeon]
MTKLIGDIVSVTTLNDFRSTLDNLGINYKVKDIRIWDCVFSFLRMMDYNVLCSLHNAIYIYHEFINLATLTRIEENALFLLNMDISEDNFHSWKNFQRLLFLMSAEDIDLLLKATKYVNYIERIPSVATLKQKR